MYEIIGDHIYYKKVKIATLNRLVPSFLDEVKHSLENDFYSEDEIAELKKTILKHET